MAVNLAAPMPQGLRHQFVLAHNRTKLEEMLFRVLKRLRCLREFMWNHSGTPNRLFVQMAQRMALFRRQSCLLLFPQFLRRNFGQFVSAGFTDEHGDFVIGRLAAMLRRESLDGGVPLRAAYAVLFEQLIRDAANLEAVIPALGIAARLNLISQITYFTRQRVPVNFSQIRTALIQRSE